MQIKLCFKCKEYIRLFEANPLCEKAEDTFDTFHSKCPTQIMSSEEFNLVRANGYMEMELTIGGKSNVDGKN